ARRRHRRTTRAWTTPTVASHGAPYPPVAPPCGCSTFSFTPRALKTQWVKEYWWLPRTVQRSNTNSRKLAPTGSSATKCSISVNNFPRTFFKHVRPYDCPYTVDCFVSDPCFLR